MSITDPELECVPVPEGWGRVIHGKTGHGHEAITLQHTVALSAVVHQLSLQKVGKQRSGENKIGRFGRNWQHIIRVRIPCGLVGFAAMSGQMELKSIAVKVPPTPVQHFLVNINSNVLPGKSFRLELVVAEMMSKTTATTSNVHNRGIEVAKSGMEYIDPEVFCFVQIENVVCKDPIGHTHPYPHVVRRNSRKLVVHKSW